MHSRPVARSYSPIAAIAALNPGKGFSSDCVGTMKEDARTVAATLPYGSSRSGLVASFTSTGASASVGGVAQVSGATAGSGAFRSPTGTPRRICSKSAFRDKPAVKPFGGTAFTGAKLYFWMLKDNQMKIRTLN